MQTDTGGKFTALSASPSKALEYLVVIAGWPTVYSVAKGGTSYAAQITTTGSYDFTQFAAAHVPLATIPKASGSSSKGRPEEGSQTIGGLKVTLMDKRDTANSGKRIGSDLMSRAAYLFGNTGTTYTTTLQTNITAADTSLRLTDATNFGTGAIVYIGQECILLGSLFAGVHTGCTRGYRLTTATPHVSGVKGYSFMPNLYRRPIFIFKGYQDFTGTAPFLLAFSGVITGDEKSDKGVTLTAAANTWEMYAAKTKKIARQLDSTLTGDFVGFSSPTTIQPYMRGDYTVFLSTTKAAPTGFGDGHYLVKTPLQWLAIKSISDEHPSLNVFGQSGQVTDFTAQVVKGICGGFIHEDLTADFTPVSFGWTNVDFSVSPPTGDEPLKLILKFLLSANGDGANNATYDVYKTGIGLGIPAAKVDIASFTALMALPDYDSNQRVFFAFTEPADAKEFIETELCKPFGYSLITGNDGRIKAIRHLSPQHLYVANPCNELAFSYTAGSGTIAAATTLRSGNLANIGNTTPATPGSMYTPAEMATEVAWALNTASSGGFTCTYSTSTNKFTIANASAFVLTSGPDNAWSMLGFTSFGASNTTQTANNSVCAPTAVAVSITESDVMDIVAVDSRDMQISSIEYWTNYDFIADKYRTQFRYIDAETVNLGDQLGARAYVLKSKGLLRMFLVSKIVFSWTDHSATSGSCGSVRVSVNPSAGFDGPGSWAEEFSYSLLARYKQPPVMLKLRLIWKHNLLEIGDVVKLSYSLNGVIADTERGTETLTGRNFEIASITHNYAAGQVDCILVGHRYQGF